MQLVIEEAIGKIFRNGSNFVETLIFTNRLNISICNNEKYNTTRVSYYIEGEFL